MKTLITTLISAFMFFGMPAFAGSHGGGKMDDKKMDIVDTAVKAGSFNTLAAALTAADLVATLKGKGPFTVFAPTDAAFAKIPKADLDALLKDKAKLTAVLTYHVVAGHNVGLDHFGVVYANTTHCRDGDL